MFHDRTPNGRLSNILADTENEKPTLYFLVGSPQSLESGKEQRTSLLSRNGGVAVVILPNNGT
jgi:hypothetical protein